MSYRAWVLLGVLLGFLAAWWQRDRRPELARVRPQLTCALALGAIAGALLFEAPADAYGWNAAATGGLGQLTDIGRTPFLGRTVLGGLIGGWIAVELVKWRLRIRGSTGDRYALPLALGLACGRMGCIAAGCCAGCVRASGDWWQAFALRGHDGAWRFPAPQTEVVFHLLSALLLMLALWRGWLPGQLLSVYLAAYAVLRFLLEDVRGNPPVVLGLTYYQYLTLILLTLALSAYWRHRSPEKP